MLEGKKTFIAMGIALAVGLWQLHFGPLPAIDPALWDIAVPVTAIILRIITKTPIGNGDLFGMVWKLFRLNK